MWLIIGLGSFKKLIFVNYMQQMFIAIFSLFTYFATFIKLPFDPPPPQAHQPQQRHIVVGVYSLIQWVTDKLMRMDFSNRDLAIGNGPLAAHDCRLQ